MSKPVLSTLTERKDNPELDQADFDGITKDDKSISHVEDTLEDRETSAIHISEAENKRLRRKIHAWLAPSVSVPTTPLLT